MGKTKKQKGGIILKKPSEEAINDFITNSDFIRLLGSGSSGIIFEANLTPGTESPYEIFRSTNYKSPVTTIIIKLVAIDVPPNAAAVDAAAAAATAADEAYEADPTDANHDAASSAAEHAEITARRADESNLDSEVIWHFLKNNIKNVERRAAFLNEINIQTDIFLKTISYLEPICPAPIYGNIKLPVDAKAFLDKLIVKTRVGGTTRQVLEHIKLRINDTQIPSLGIVCMEIAEGYDTLNNCYVDGTSNNDIRKFECMARLEYIRLALQTGYSQNDWHPGNVLVNKTVNNFYKYIPGRVLLIDFGYASKIPLDKLNNMRELVRAGNYSDALQIFNTLSRSDGLIMNTYPSYYGWITNKYDNVTKTETQPDTDEKLNSWMTTLKDARQEAINARIAEYNSPAHNGDREQWPYLPLSNAIKNKLFSGILVGGGNRKKRQFRSKLKKKTCKKRNSKLRYKK